MTRPTSRRCVSGVLAAVVALCFAPARADAQTAPLIDHFKCYRTTSEPPNAEVLLRDQFDPAGTADKAIVRFPVKFCTPVEKTTPDGVVTPIKDPNAHLEMFLTAPGRLEPTRRIVSRNQFGTARLLTYGPEILAVPSAKNSQPPPENLDHFKCYRTYGGSKRIPLRLSDQFQEAATATVLRPRLFCNPVEKTHGAVTTPIKNEKDHLLCYTIAGTTFEGGALARNQFGERNLPLATADLLCVPSEKLRVSIVAP